MLSPMAHAVPVPDDKDEYVGDWVGENMRLVIGKDGRIAYKRDSDGLRADVTIELKSFHSERFDAGVGFIRTTFVVSRTPYRDGSTMKMTVDGVELTKIK